MNTSRRAASHAPTGAPARAVRTAVVSLAAALGAVLAAGAAVAVRMAREVVIPASREAADEVLAVDLAAQTVTLARTPDTELPGRYGLFTTGSEPYVKVGAVLSADARSVRRKLLTEIRPGATLSERVAFSGWYYDEPDQLHLPFTDELIGSAVGACPAWLFPADDPASDTWVIQVHGRGTSRAECLRAVPVFHAMGLPVLVVSYRNDGDAPRTRSGRCELGASEWRDVDAAIGFAVARGASRVVLMGWSMGGAVVLQTALNSPRAEQITGIVLDSPVVDWRTVLRFQADQRRVPPAVTDLAFLALQSPVARALTGAAPVPLGLLDVVARAGELRHPILILHSDDDGFVPSDASHALARARPDLVRLESFHTARHTKLWNYDPQRWSGVITQWVGGLPALREQRVQ